MTKSEQKPRAVVEHPVTPMPPTGCVVCGSYAGTFVEVTKDVRAHAECAVSHPHVIAKVKARA